METLTIKSYYKEALFEKAHGVILNGADKVHMILNSASLREVKNKFDYLDVRKNLCTIFSNNGELFYIDSPQSNYYSWGKVGENDYHLILGKLELFSIDQETLDLLKKKNTEVLYKEFPLLFKRQDS